MIDAEAGPKRLIDAGHLWLWTRRSKSVNEETGESRRLPGPTALSVPGNDWKQADGAEVCRLGTSALRL